MIDFFMFIIWFVLAFLILSFNKKINDLFLFYVLKIFYKIPPRNLLYKIIRLILQLIEKLLLKIDNDNNNLKIDYSKYKNSNDEFKFFIEKIKKWENFSLSRYQDWEYSFIIWESVTAWEWWKSPSSVEDFWLKLKETLHISNSNFYYWVSDPFSDKKAYNFFISHIENKSNVTMWNIFTWKNSEALLEFLEKHQDEWYLICNESWKSLNNIWKFIIKDKFLVNNSADKFYYENWKQFIDILLNKVSEVNNKLFLFASWPLSNIFIYECYKKNPNNIYLDIWSSLDQIIHWKKTRTYMNKSSKEYNLIYYIPIFEQWENFIEDNWVTVVLNVFRRQQNLQKQIDAINKQTIKPKEIIILQNYYEWEKELSAELKNNYTVFTCSKNTWVWWRFAIALISKTKYICIFDDDTIPWEKWFENCINENKKKRGLYWTIWLIYENTFEYYNNKRVWWHNNAELDPNITQEVDIVWHSWFFEREMLTKYWQDSDVYLKEPLAWEDMHFSYILQKYMSLSTYVPPHPFWDKSLWWSIDWEKYWNDEVALWKNWGDTKFEKVYKEYINKWFKILNSK